MARVGEFSVQLVLAGLAVLMCASVALAHCFPDQTTPSAGSAVGAAPPQVVMHFDNEFNPAASSIRVLNENGDLVSGAGEPSSDQHTITVPLKPLAPGQYFVKWRAV